MKIMVITGKGIYTAAGNGTDVVFEEEVRV